MNATITKAIWDEIDTLHADPTSDGSSKHCVTIEGESANSWASFWIQLYAGSINFRHLDDDQRDEVLGMILDPIDTPDDMQLMPGECVTFDISAMGRPVVDALLFRLINEYFLILDGGALDISTEEL